MPGRPPKPRDGRRLKNAPTGFPLFYDKRKPRVVTSDPWAFLAHHATTKLPKDRERIALAYIEQAFDFFEATSNPQLGSKPLLHYYCFLNLVKAALLIKGVSLPTAVGHGISDPRVNRRQRLRFTGQRVHITGRAHDHSQLFPEFLQLLNAAHLLNSTCKVITMLGNIPSIHRTFTQVTGDDPIFLPVKRFDFMHAGGQIWLRVVLNRHDKDVELVRPTISRRQRFRRWLDLVHAPNPDEFWYETAPVQGRNRAVDRAIGTLATRISGVGAASILTSTGYRMYLSASPPGTWCPRLAASYAVAFYLGSITRYQPHDFDKIVAGGYRWLVEEFLATEPIQFIYTLASWLAGVDVVKPYATSR